jgi:hypothetical protein
MSLDSQLRLQKMSHIVALAQELQVYMARSLDVRDLINLSTTCIALRSILESEIYQTISWTWHHSSNAVWKISRPMDAKHGTMARNRSSSRHHNSIINIF